MNRWRRWCRCSLRGSQSALLLLGLGGLALGCGGTPSDDGSTAADSDPTDSADTEDVVGWFEIGWGQDEFVALADGDDFPIVRGGQGAEMFPVPLRGAGFYLPGNPTSWLDETGPRIDVVIDIDGFNTGVAGHFKYLANYQLDWVVLADGTYQSSFISLLVPDGIDPEDLEGLPAHMVVRLTPQDQPTLERVLDVVVTVQSEPPPV